MTSTPEPDSAPAIADEQLLAAHDLALTALREITPATTIGEPAGHRIEAEGVVSLLFENRMEGYPGWFWTVSLARVEDADPTVLEVELLPGDHALLAPDWVPWAVRLAEYQAQQVLLAEEALAAGVVDDEELDEDELGDELDEDDDLDDEDVEDLDASDFDIDGSRHLHAGDVDGVDIDELDEAADTEAEASDALDDLSADDSADASDEDDFDEDEFLREV